MTHTKEKKRIPELRFPEFEEEWKQEDFKDVVKINQGLQIAIVERLLKPERDSLFYITNEFLNPKSTKRYYIKNASKSVICNEDDILMTRTGNTGKVVTNVNGAFHNNFFKIAYPKSVDKKYLYNYLILPKTQNLIARLAGTSTIPDLNHSDFYKIKFIFPSLPEQQKIASFLTAVDSRIQTLEKKKRLLTDYKKGVMQKIFTKEIRFRDEDGKEYPEWEKKKLGEYLSVSKIKNENLIYSKKEVLSVSGEYGIVNQIEFQGRSFAGASVHNYGVVESGDIVYTKSPLKSNPYGIIKVNKGHAGIVSTLYAVYKVKDQMSDGLFLDYYFQLDDNTNKYLRPLVRKGAKNDMKINNEYVLHDPVLFPSKKEQTRIADFLTALDEKIDGVSDQIEKTRAYKKGLLQKMFV